MAYPFGGHPTIAAYVLWARDTHGFRAQTIAATDENGKSHTVVRISKDGGPSVVVPTNAAQSERLTPSMLGYLDRRLGLVCPWFTVEAPIDEE
jgi:predicted PhzF superfamily epimerase YddE/YHI9